MPGIEIALTLLVALAALTLPRPAAAPARVRK